MANWLKIFFFSELRSERTIKTSLLHAAIPMALFAALSLPQFLADRPLDVHRWSQVQTLIELSVNDEFCGACGYITDTEKYRLYDLLSKDAAFLDTPIKNIIDTQFDGLERYCGTLNIPLIKNENSLRVVLDFLISLHRNITLNQIGKAFFLIKFIILCILIVVLIRFGASAALALLSACIGLSVISYFKGDHFYSTYSFTFVFMILCVLLYSTFMKNRRPASLELSTVIIFPFVMGFVTGFVTNIRTSHFPALFMLFVTYFVCRHISAFRNKLFGLKSVGIGIAVVAVFFLGYKLYGMTFIQPLIPHWDNPTNYAHHSIMHSLVLGLAVPENKLSKEENITWNDAIGLEIAKRIDPDVRYLSPEYGKVLLEYYVNLWIYKTQQMIDTYMLKIKTAGVSAVDNAIHIKNGKIYNIILYPLHFIRNGGIHTPYLHGIFFSLPCLILQDQQPLVFLTGAFCDDRLLAPTGSSSCLFPVLPELPDLSSFLASFLINFGLCVHI